MKHLGDITKINGYEAPIVDIVTGGSPCQDLSVAGKREGLDGERSGLFMEQIRIVKEMRDHDKSTGRTGIDVRPRFMVWENVPGALSSNKGADFQTVLTEIIRIAIPNAPDVPMPSNGKWPNAGYIYDEVHSVSLAYRVHDAQYWGKTIRDSRTGDVLKMGTPQRRRRIALVADFGGLSAGEILFERQGLHGDSKQSGAERKEPAGDSEGGSHTSSFTLKIRGGREVDSLGKKAGKGPLVQTELSGTLGVSQDQTLFAIPINDKATRFEGGGKLRHNDGSANGLLVGEQGDPSYTVTAGDRHAVAENQSKGAK